MIVDLPLDAVGHVPWWPPEYSEVTLHHILVHTIAEAHRHVGHADIVRELVDGSVILTQPRPLSAADLAEMDRRRGLGG